MYYKLQTLIFSKSDWSLKEARKYLKEHGFKTDVDIKPQTYRFRQREPKKNVEYKTLTRSAGNRVVHYVFMIEK